MNLRTTPVRAVAAGAALALAGTLLATTADAEPRATTTADRTHSDVSRDGIVGHDLTTADGARGRRLARSVDDYWTPERMASAKPAVSTVGAAEARLAGRMPVGERVAPGTGSKPVAGTPSVMRTAERKSYSRRVGKMFYKFNKKNWVCSGAVVNTKKKNMVFTAAHCLWDKKKGWAHKILFIPGYKKGKEPFGRYYAKHIAIGAHFKKFHGVREDPRHDYGIMLVKNSRRHGPKIARKVGAFGIQWNAKYSRKMKATGYPAFHTSGGVQKSCKGRTHYSKYSWRGAKMITMKCRAVTAGSSGGPWLHRAYINGQNAGVNSFKHPRRIFTPWFTRGVKKLYKSYD